MDNKRDFRLIKADEIYTPDATLLADFYSTMLSDEQAEFWKIVAENFTNFGGGRGCQQNCAIAERLSDKAKEYLQNLYEHASRDTLK